jgi:hypothetical protein
MSKPTPTLMVLTQDRKFDKITVCKGSMIIGYAEPKPPMKLGRFIPRYFDWAGNVIDARPATLVDRLFRRIVK